MTDNEEEIEAAHEVTLAVPGVVAANNFISLFNPVASGVTISLGAAYVSSFAIAADLTPAPLNGFRITAASAGTLQTNSTAVSKFQSAMPTSLAEIRTGNPTCTIGAQIFNASPVVAGGANGGSTTQNIAAAPAVYPPLRAGTGGPGRDRLSNHPRAAPISRRPRRLALHAVSRPR